MKTFILAAALSLISFGSTFAQGVSVIVNGRETVQNQPLYSVAPPVYRVAPAYGTRYVYSAPSDGEAVLVRRPFLDFVDGVRFNSQARAYSARNRYSRSSGASVRVQVETK